MTEKEHTRDQASHSGPVIELHGDTTHIKLSDHAISVRAMGTELYIHAVGTELYIHAIGGDISILPMPPCGVYITVVGADGT